jgi:hypothetical protein
MEDIEVRALAQAAHKPLSWFRCVDDTFVIWPLESQKLERFFDHLNGLHRNTQVTVDIEIDGHLSFLGIDIYRRPDGSLDRQVFRKPTHTKPYLSPESHHRPSNTQAVPSPWCTEPGLCVTTSMMSWSSSRQRSGKMGIVSDRYGGPLFWRLELTSRKTTPPRSLFFRMSGRHMVDPAECWLNQH